MKQLTPTPVMQFTDDSGAPLSGGKVYTYEAGTTNPLATYIDYQGSSANTNPVILDSRGEASIWLNEDTLYRLELKDANDVLIWTADDVGTPPNTGAVYVETTGNQTIDGVKTFNERLIIQGMTVGATTPAGNPYTDTNTIVGKEAGGGGYGVYNSTSIGYRALNINDSNNCTAVGAYALTSSESGLENTAVGTNALQMNITGDNNTAVGNDALKLSDGNDNTAVGSGALASIAKDPLDSTSGRGNTAVGIDAGGSLLLGSDNVIVGNSAMVTSSVSLSNNVALGKQALMGTLYSNAVGLGDGAAVSAAFQVQLGNGLTTTYAYGAVQDRSDLRDKADVRNTTLGLDFIKALRPVDFKWDMREDYRTPPPKLEGKTKAEYNTALLAWAEANRLTNITHDGSKKRKRYHHGLIAQEVAALGVDFGGLQHHAINGGEDVYSIGYEELVAPLIKAVQELSAEVDKLKNGG